MKKALLTILIIATNIAVLTAQNTDGCDGIRYIDEVFPSTIQSTVKYGENLNFGVVEELFMDIYEPESDSQSKRPVVIFAHGGAFLAGTRALMSDLCIEYAKRGYVAATIDYRKLQGGTILDTVNVVEAIVRTMQDMKAAVRFFKNDSNNSNSYRVDTNFVFVGGYSAGALTALHTAYWNEGDNSIDYINNIISAEGGFEGQTNDFFDVSSKVHGVINHSGGILDEEWMQSEEPAIVSYHGVNDNVVPIGTGLAANAIILDGSEVIHQKAIELNIPNYFHPVTGGGHDDIFSGAFAMEYSNYLDSSFVFFENILCRQTTSVPNVLDQNVKIDVYPNPSFGLLQIDCKPYKNKNLNISIYDSLGRLVDDWSLDSSPKSIDLNFAEPGLYFYRINTNSGNAIQNGKIILYK